MIKQNKTKKTTKFDQINYTLGKNISYKICRYSRHSEYCIQKLVLYRNLSPWSLCNFLHNPGFPIFTHGRAVSEFCMLFVTVM